MILAGCLLAAVIASAAQEKVFPKLTGPYLGQKPPGLTPEVFAPGVVSTGAHEFAGSFPPDGKSLFFSGGERGKGDICWVSTEILRPPEPGR